ncbi:MAG: hypothetical protein HY298_23115 [Verrucomicrobia bacterium]|nr:hypothetical protein [Verrucomicrobiota bacterium]
MAVSLLEPGKPVRFEVVGSANSRRWFGNYLARAALGNDVVDFCVHTARLEAQAFNDAVTDWERIRYFERI